MRPKICLKFAFKNFKYIVTQIISLCSILSPPLHCSSPSPIIPSATMTIQARVSEEQGKIRWARSKYNPQQMISPVLQITAPI